MEEQTENERNYNNEDEEDLVQGGWVTVTTNNVRVMSPLQILM